MTLRGGARAARERPRRATWPRRGAAMGEHVRAMLDLKAAGRGRLRLRQQHPRRGAEGGRRGRLRLPRLRARLHPAAVLRGQGPVPLGRALGRSGGHARDRRRRARDVPGRRGARTAGSAWRASGSSSRACPRASAGSATASARRWAGSSTSSCAAGEVKAPIVIGRDHLDAGSVASPNRETEAMNDGSDAVADWPILNALLNAVAGATWVSVHHGGGVGIGYSIHAGMVVVADGTPEAARPPRARAHHRPRHGRHAPRRRRLRERDRRRARRGASTSRCCETRKPRYGPAEARPPFTREGSGGAYAPPSSTEGGNSPVAVSPPPKIPLEEPIALLTPSTFRLSLIHMDVVTELREHGIQPSAQRVAVGEYVLSTTDHPSADQVWSRRSASASRWCRGRPSTTRSTCSWRRGCCARSCWRRGRIVFDPKTDSHHHFIDERTGEIVRRAVGRRAT